VRNTNIIELAHVQPSSKPVLGRVNSSVEWLSQYSTSYLQKKRKVTSVRNPLLDRRLTTRKPLARTMSSASGALHAINHHHGASTTTSSSTTSTAAGVNASAPSVSRSARRVSTTIYHTASAVTVPALAVDPTLQDDATQSTPTTPTSTLSNPTPRSTPPATHDSLTASPPSSPASPH
jgi:hypothetical protein